MHTKSARRPPIRIAFLLQDLLFGGTQRHALELARRLNPEYFSVRIWTLAGGEDFAPKAREYGLRVVDLRPRGPVGPAALAALWKRLGEEPVDILSALTVVPNIWGRLMGRLRKVPCVLGNCRGIADLPKQHESLLWRLADMHVCNAQAIRQRLLQKYGLPENRVAVISNGVDAAYYRPAEPGEQGPEKIVLCAARMVPEKDLATLVAAFAEIRGKHPHAVLKLVGDGPLLPEILKKIGEMGLGDQAQCCKATPDLRPFFKQATVFALSSRHEGLPNVVLEAMSSGLPVVSTAAGGVPELALHGETGLLSPTGDASALARSLDMVLSNPRLGREMGEHGRKRVLEHFSLDAMVRRHEELFLQALSQSQRRRSQP